MFELITSVPQPVQPPTETTVGANKPKTKPIPTVTSNKYAIFAGDEAEDEIETNDKVITNEVDTTEPGPSNNNNKSKPDDTSVDEESQLTAATKNFYEDHHANTPHGMPPTDDDDDDTVKQLIPAAKLGSVNINNKERNISEDEESQLSAVTEIFDDDYHAVNVPHGMPPQNDNDTMSEPYDEDLELGSVTNNKNMVDDMFDDEASQVTVATKNSAKDQHYHEEVPDRVSPKTITNERPIDFDLFPASSAGQDDVQLPKHPTKPRKSRRNRNKNKNKKKSTRKQRMGNKQQMTMKTREAVPVVRPQGRPRIPR